MPALKRHVRLAGEIKNQKTTSGKRTANRGRNRLDYDSHARATRRVGEIASRRKLPKRESERCGLRSKKGAPVRTREEFVLNHTPPSRHPGTPEQSVRGQGSS